MSQKTRESYREYLKTDHWDNLRKQALERDGYRCRRCQAANQILQVHHKIYRDTWESADLADLETLCVPCHKKEHQPHWKPPKKKKHHHQKRKRKKHRRRIVDNDPKKRGWYRGMYEGISEQQARAQVGTAPSSRLSVYRSV